MGTLSAPLHGCPSLPLSCQGLEGYRRRDGGDRLPLRPQQVRAPLQDAGRACRLPLLSSALKPSSSLCPGSRRWATPSDCLTTSPSATSWRPFLTSSSPPFPASTPTLSLFAPSSQRRWPTW